jgi:hypothetical protein
MPTTSDGTYTRVANSFSGPVTGTAIDPTDAEAFFDEVESEITDRLSRSGKGGMSANLSLDGNDVTDVDAVVFDGSSSGTATLRAPAAAGTTTVTLPDSTSTLATLALTETLSNKTLSLIPTGSAAAPSISFQSSNAGLYGGSDQVNIAVNGTQAFQAMYSGGTYYIGSPTQATGAFPEFTFEDGGRTKLRTRSLIIGDPGDTAEVGRYCGAGDPVTYTPWPGKLHSCQHLPDHQSIQVERRVAVHPHALHAVTVRLRRWHENSCLLGGQFPGQSASQYQRLGQSRADHQCRGVRSHQQLGGRFGMHIRVQSCQH